MIVARPVRGVLAWPMIGCTCLGLGFVVAPARGDDPPAPTPRLPRDDLLVFCGPAGAATPVRSTALWLNRRAEILANMALRDGEQADVGLAARDEDQKTTGTRFQFVPYRGGAPAMQALLAGQMDLGFEQAANVLPHLRSGIIKAYAVTSSSRLPAAPEVPTVEEAGLAGFYVSVWHGLWAPKGTPKDVVAALNNAVARALHEPVVRQRLIDLGQDIPVEAQQTPEALAALQKAEIEKWWPIVKAAGIKAE